MGVQLHTQPIGGLSGDGSVSPQRKISIRTVGLRVLIVVRLVDNRRTFLQLELHSVVTSHYTCSYLFVCMTVVGLV